MAFGDFGKAFDRSFGGSGRTNNATDFRFGRVTSNDAYKKFLASGDLLTRDNGIARTGLADRSVLDTSEAGAKNKALRQARADVGLHGDSSGDKLVRVDQDQVDLLTGLFEKRLNEISARRSRPGLSQVK